MTDTRINIQVLGVEILSQPLHENVRALPEIDELSVKTTTGPPYLEGEQSMPLLKSEPIPSPVRAQILELRLTREEIS